MELLCLTSTLYIVGTLEELFYGRIIRFDYQQRSVGLLNRTRSALISSLLFHLTLRKLHHVNGPWWFGLVKMPLHRYCVYTFVEVFGKAKIFNAHIVKMN